MGTFFTIVITYLVNPKHIFGISFFYPIYNLLHRIEFLRSMISVALRLALATIKWCILLLRTRTRINIITHFDLDAKRELWTQIINSYSRRFSTVLLIIFAERNNFLTRMRGGDILELLPNDSEQVCNVGIVPSENRTINVYL